MIYRRDFDIALLRAYHGTQVAAIRCEQPGCDEYARWWRPIEGDYACLAHRNAPGVQRERV